MLTFPTDLTSFRRAEGNRFFVKMFRLLWLQRHLRASLTLTKMATCRRAFFPGGATLQFHGFQRPRLSLALHLVCGPVEWRALFGRTRRWALQFT